MAQQKDHVEWKVSAVRVSDREALIRFQMAIDSGWHVYSRNNRMNDVQMKISFEKSELFDLIGNVIEETTAIERFDNILGQPVRIFERYGSFSQRIRLDAQRQVVKGSIRFVLNAGNDLPKVQGLSFSVTVNPVNNNNSVKVITVNN